MRQRRGENVSIVLKAALAGVLWTTAWGLADGFVKPGEMQLKDKWAQQYLLGQQAKIPFSFLYADQPSKDFLNEWPKTTQSKKLDTDRTQHSIVWTDAKSGLEIRCEAVDYSDYPAIEWTAYFKNTGTENTPVLKEIQGLDVVFQRGQEGEFILNGIQGDSCAANSYEPYAVQLDANMVKRFAPPSYSGKSCDGPQGWPYFNLQAPGYGVIMAVGWPGQWACSFTRDASNGLTVRAGQELTNLYLKPGEQIRTPLIAMLFWQDSDVVRAQNLWRRWYIAHTIPRVDGQPQSPIIQIQCSGGQEEIPGIEALVQAGAKPDVCWRDAGGDYTWYPSAGGPYGPNSKMGGPAWLNTGTWEIDPTKYPEGFRKFSDRIGQHGIKFLLWFEPERVGDPESWLGKNHPEWLLPGTSHGALLDEGNPAALNWLIDHIDAMIKSQGIAWYREDMNGGGPLPAWRKNDPADRQGMTENLYVQGHLTFWDELRRRNPGLSIDSCASGGRRNDLETMRRAVPLLRSDFEFPEMANVIEGNHGLTYGLSFWLPFQGSGCRYQDPYSYRSFYMSSFGMIGGSLEIQKKAVEECRRVAPYMLLGDYYPLTPYSLQRDRWIAWQFNRPEQGSGVVQAFRHSECEAVSMTFQLKGLESAAQYRVTNFDSPTPSILSGRELMENGLTVQINDKPGSAVIEYKIIE